MKRIIFFKNKKLSIYLYPVASVILFSLSYNYPTFWLLGFFSLIPLIKFLYQVKNKKELFIGLFIFSFLAYNFLMSWLWSVDILAWSGISDFWLSKLIIFFYINYFVLLVGVLPFLLFFYLFYKFKSKTFVDIFLFSSLWVSMEWLRTFIYSVVCYDENSLFGAHNTLCFAGYILGSSDNLLQLAQFGGVYFLTFVFVFINFLIYWFFFRAKTGFSLKFKILFSAFLILILFFPFSEIFHSKENKKKSLKVSVLNTRFESFFEMNTKELEKRNNEYLRLLLEIEENNFNPDIIIFPEGAGFNNLLVSYDQIDSYYEEIFSDINKLIVDSGWIFDDRAQLKSRFTYYDVKNNIIDKYDKKLLTPGAEYLPESFSLIVDLLGFDDWLKENKSRQYSKGRGINISNLKNNKVGGVSCFEIVSPEISREITRKGANFFINPSSHSSFNGNLIFRNQTINIIKTRAVENNRFFILSGNYIPSMIVSNKGDLIIARDNQDILDGKIQLVSSSTFYACFGNWLVGVSFGIVVFFGVKKYRQKINKKT